MKKVLIISGKTASGKDTLRRELCQKYFGKFSEVVASTTRPKRLSEVEGREYNFVGEKEMVQKIYTGEVMYAENFNDWIYAIEESALKLDYINIVIVNPQSIEEWRSDEYEIFKVLVEEKEDTRMMRYLLRDSADTKELRRRLDADDKDFRGVEELYDFSGTFDECLHAIECHYKLKTFEQIREEKFAKQRREWGFDEQGLWSLDDTVERFIESRLEKFLEVAPLSCQREFYLDGEEKTLEEMVKACLFEIKNSRVTNEDHCAFVIYEQIRGCLWF
ncbi:MAG: hypothetical protein ACRCZZ_04200 [Phocaeicola sp.]